MGKDVVMRDYDNGERVMEKSGRLRLESVEWSLTDKKSSRSWPGKRWRSLEWDSEGSYSSSRECSAVPLQFGGSWYAGNWTSVAFSSEFSPREAKSVMAWPQCLLKSAKWDSECRYDTKREYVSTLFGNGWTFACQKLKKSLLFCRIVAKRQEISYGMKTKMSFE